jgi:hypothetical protein
MDWPAAWDQAERRGVHLEARDFRTTLNSYGGLAEPDHGIP